MKAKTKTLKTETLMLPKDTEKISAKIFKYNIEENNKN